MTDDNYRNAQKHYHSAAHGMNRDERLQRTSKSVDMTVESSTELDAAQLHKAANDLDRAYRDGDRRSAY